jgi:hypothetical protein
VNRNPLCKAPIIPAVAHDIIKEHNVNEGACDAVVRTYEGIAVKGDIEGWMRHIMLFGAHERLSLFSDIPSIVLSDGLVKSIVTMLPVGVGV